MLPAAVRSASASTTLSFSELNTVLVVLLCTLRGRRHQRPRNTRYRAGATPYPNRTFTGWIAPASPGAREQTLKLFHWKPSPAVGMWYDTFPPRADDYKGRTSPSCTTYPLDAGIDGNSVSAAAPTTRRAHEGEAVGL